jgi:hypothetical protein
VLGLDRVDAQAEDVAVLGSSPVVKDEHRTESSLCDYFGRPSPEPPRPVFNACEGRSVA